MPGFSLLFHRENGLNASTRIKIFPFLVVAFGLCRGKTERSISTRQLIMPGQLNHLVPASLVSRVRRRSRQLTQNKIEDSTGGPDST